MVAQKRNPPKCPSRSPRSPRRDGRDLPRGPAHPNLEFCSCGAVRVIPAAGEESPPAGGGSRPAAGRPPPAGGDTQTAARVLPPAGGVLPSAVGEPRTQVQHRRISVRVPQISPQRPESRVRSRVPWFGIAPPRFGLSQLGWSRRASPLRLPAPSRRAPSQSRRIGTRERRCSRRASSLPASAPTARRRRAPRPAAFHPP